MISYLLLILLQFSVPKCGTSYFTTRYFLSPLSPFFSGSRMACLGGVTKMGCFPGGYEPEFIKIPTSAQIGVRNWWTLFLLAIMYTMGELGHFLLGTVSRPMAQELHFGDKACFKTPNMTNISSDLCSGISNEIACGAVNITTTSNYQDSEIIYPCKWDYNGLGLPYHILAGPAFIAVFTVTAIGWGYLADKKNRVKCLSLATFFFSIAILGTSLATNYWHVFFARMALAAWESSCTPLATGIIADLFPRKNRGFAMGIFHSGIYIGYGTSFTLGNHVTAANLFEKGWRASYFLAGLPGFAIALLFLLTATEPERTRDEEELSKSSSKTIIISEKQQGQLPFESRSGWDTVKNPAMIFLVLGACVRHAGGFCWGYNSALYFKTYYPDYDVSTLLTVISIGAGVSGCFLGGWLSDCLVKKRGISARALVLGISQLLASPFAFAQFFVSPPLALIFLLGGYLAAEVWFGVMFALLVELVPAEIRSSAVAIALFCINNVGGNTPVLVNPIAQAFTYRTSILILYPGALFTSSILFFICWAILQEQKKKADKKKALC